MAQDEKAVEPVPGEVQEQMVVDHSIFSDDALDAVKKKALEQLTPENKALIESVLPKVRERESSLLSTMPNATLQEVLERSYRFDIYQRDEKGNVVYDENKFPKIDLSKKSKRRNLDKKHKGRSLYMDAPTFTAEVIKAIGVDPLSDQGRAIFEKYKDVPLFRVNEMANLGVLGKGIKPSIRIFEERTKRPKPAVPAPELMDEKGYLPKAEIEEKFEGKRKYTRYQFHKDNPSEPFTQDFTAQDWLDEFNREIGSIASATFEKMPGYKVYNFMQEHSPNFGSSTTWTTYQKRNPNPAGFRREMMGLQGMSDDNFGRLVSRWESDRLRAINSLKTKAYRRMVKQGQWPEGVIIEGYGDEMEGFPEKALEDRGGFPLEASLGPTISPEIQRALGETVDVEMDRETLGADKLQVPLSGLLNLRASAKDVEAGLTEEDFQAMMAWGRSSLALKEAAGRAADINEFEQTRAGGGSPSRMTTDMAELQGLWEQYKVERDRRLQKGETLEEINTDFRDKFSKSTDIRDSRKKIKEYGKAQESWEKEYDVAYQAEAGAGSAVALPLRVWSGSAGLLSGGVESLSGLAAAQVSGVEPQDLRILRHSTPKDRAMFKNWMGNYPNLPEWQKKQIGHLMIEGNNLLTEMSKSEADRVKKMLDKDTLDRINANADELIEGIAAIPVLALGPTGQQYMNLASNHPERIFASMKQAYETGRMFSNGAVISYYHMASNPVEFFRANPLDAIMFAAPLAKQLALGQKSKDLVKLLGEKGAKAVGLVLKYSDEIARKLDEKAKSRFARIAVTPVNASRFIAHKLSDAARYGADSTANAAARIKAFLADPYHQYETGATILMNEVMDGVSKKGETLKALDSEMRGLLSEGKVREATDLVKVALEDVYGPGWRDLDNTKAMVELVDYLELVDEVDAKKWADDAGPQNAEKIAPVIGEVFKSIRERSAQSVAEGTKQGEFIVPSNLMDAADQALFGDQRGGRRTTGSEGVARAALLEPEGVANSDIFFTDPRRAAADLREMVKSGDPFLGRERPTGTQTAQELSKRSAHDMRYIATEELHKSDPQKAKAYEDKGHQNLLDGLKDKQAVNKTIDDLENNFVNLEDPEVLKSLGIELDGVDGANRVLRRLGATDQSIREMRGKKRLNKSDFKEGLEPHREGAGTYVRKERIQALIDKPPATDVPTGLTARTIDHVAGVEVPALLKELKAKRIDISQIPKPKSRTRADWYEYADALNNALKGVDPADLGVPGRLRKDVSRRLESMGHNLDEIERTLGRNITRYEAEILKKDIKSFYKWVVGQEYQTLQRKLDELDTSAPHRKAMEESLRGLQKEYLAKVLGKKGAITIADELAGNAIASSINYLNRKKRGDALRKEASVNVEHFITDDIINGRRVERLPGAIDENPAQLVARLRPGGSLYEKLYQSKKPGVTDRQFEVSIKNLRQRLGRYVDPTVKSRHSKEFFKQARIQEFLGLKDSEKGAFFVPRSTVKQLAWEELSRRPFHPLHSMAKGGVTAGNLGSHITNWGTHAGVQFSSRGKLMTPSYLLREGMDMFEDLTPEAYAKMVDPNIDPFYAQKRIRANKALRELNFIDRTNIDKEFNAILSTIDDPAAAARFRKAYGNLLGGLEKAQGFSRRAYGGMDKLGKWEEAHHSFRFIDESYNRMSERPGAFVEWLTNPEGRKVRVRKRSGKPQLWDAQNKSWKTVTDEELARIQAQAASTQALLKLFDYDKLPNVVKLNKLLSGTIGVGLPFWTWFYKAMDIPGVKKGLGEQMFSADPYLYTNDINVLKWKVPRDAKNFARMQAAQNLTRDRINQLPEEVLEKLFSFVPGEKKPALFKMLGRDGIVGTKDLGYLTPVGPTKLLLQALSAATTSEDAAKALEDILEDKGVAGVEAAWLGKDGNVELELTEENGYRNPDGSLNEAGKEKRALRLAIRNQLTKPDRTGFLVSNLAGLGGGIYLPLINALSPLFQGDPANTEDLIQAARKIGLTLAFGATTEKATDMLLAELERRGVQTPPGFKSSFQKTMRRHGKPTYSQLNEIGVNVLKEGLRKLTSIGFDLKNVAKDKSKYLKREARNYRHALTSEVTKEIAKIQTEPGDPESAKDPRNQERLDNLLEYKNQMEEIIQSEMEILDRQVTNTLNLALSSRKRGKRKSSYFVTARDRSGKVVRRYYRINDQGEKIFLEDEEKTYDLENWPKSGITGIEYYPEEAGMQPSQDYKGTQEMFDEIQILPGQELGR